MKIFKKALSSIIIVIFTFSMFSALTTANVYASETTVDGFTYTLLDDGTAKITNFDIIDTTTDVVVPSEINGYTVSAVSGFSYTDITSITLPSTLTSISYGAFENCKKLETAVIPDSIKTIEAFAFNDCESLKNITLPEGIENIKHSAFSYCSSLEKVVFPSTVKKLGSSSFASCTSLTEVILPEGIEDIGAAFAHCTALENIVIPSSIKCINSGTFYNCTSLVDVTLPEGLESIEAHAFTYCDSLASLTIPSTVTSISTNAFTYDVTFNGYAGTYIEEYVTLCNSDYGFEHTLVDITGLKGDINLDGVVNVKDATLLQKFLVELETLTNPQLLVADTTDNGRIDIKDVRYILKTNADLV